MPERRLISAARICGLCLAGLALVLASEVVYAEGSLSVRIGDSLTSRFSGTIVTCPDAWADPFTSTASEAPVCVEADATLSGAASAVDELFGEAGFVAATEWEYEEPASALRAWVAGQRIIAVGINELDEELVWILVGTTSMGPQ